MFQMDLSKLQDCILEVLEVTSYKAHILTVKSDTHILTVKSDTHVLWVMVTSVATPIISITTYLVAIVVDLSPC